MNITPVFKKGVHNDPSNYRPISLTSICCKTLEHIIFHSIMEHLNSNNIIIDNQDGFRSGHPCQTQLVSLVEDITYALDNHLQVDFCFCLIGCPTGNSFRTIDVSYLSLY